MAHTVYRRHTANGNMHRQVVGMPLLASGFTLAVPQAILKDAGIDPPEQGDVYFDDEEVMWTVSADPDPDVDLSGGTWTLAVT